MSQITTGIRSVLDSPVIYDLFQKCVGAKKVYKELAFRYLMPEEGSHFLDIGCGPASILDYINVDIEYVGYDISEKYINAASLKYMNSKFSFINSRYTESDVDAHSPFDLIFASGLLHHLGDDEVKALFGLISLSLNNGGRFVSIDPCRIENQNFISKYLVENDRGQNVRSVTELEQLAKTVFSNVKAVHRDDLLRIPYDHVILECKP